MDYGRYKYEQKKKAGKSKGHAASLKEVKLRPRTDQHDLDFKLKNARRFLADGDKVKVTVMYRGREMVHRGLGREQLDKVVELLGPIATVESPPRMEGRLLSMILVPNREVIEAERKAEAKAEAAVAAALGTDGSDETETVKKADAPATEGPTEAPASEAAAAEGE